MFYLNLSNNAITDYSARSLASFLQSLEHSPQLQHLLINDNPAFGDGINMLAEALSQRMSAMNKPEYREKRDDVDGKLFMMPLLSLGLGNTGLTDNLFVNLLSKL